MKTDNERVTNDFPVAWERDHYVARRELSKFLVLGSTLLAGASALIAAVGRWLRPAHAGPRARVATLAEIAPGDSRLFHYPTEADACILVRRSDGELRAYSQVCTHLSCAVIHQPKQDALLCPCHHGWFDASSGLPTAGPPTRRLPRILLETDGDGIYAVGREP